MIPVGSTMTGIAKSNQTKKRKFPEIESDSTPEQQSRDEEESSSPPSRLNSKKRTKRMRK